MMEGLASVNLMAWWPDRVAWPWVLWLCSLPWLMRWRRGADDHMDGPALRLPWTLPVSGRRGASAGRPEWARHCLVLAWCLFCVTLSRPQQLGEPQAPPSTARQLMLALDISGSMNEPDMQLGGRRVDRITAAHAVLDDFLSKRQGDHIGLIIFGQQAFVLTPLTPDLATVRAQLDDAEVGLAGNDTAIGDAIALAVKRLRHQQQGQRVLVLLTDGMNTTGNIDPVRAAELAAHDHVRVHTIALGGDGSIELFGLRIPGQAPNLDEAGLQAIAQTTGGQFFRARDSAELAGIYDRIDQLEPIDVQSLPVRPWIERYPPWLCLALLCLIASVIVGRPR